MKKTKTSKTSNSSLRKHFKMNYPAVLLFVLFLVLGGLFALNSIKKPSEKSAIKSYEDCVKANGQLTDTYPKHCIKKGRWIEPVPEVVDSSSWTSYKGNVGLTFKCPPSWQCTDFDENSVVIQQSHYLTIVTFQIIHITPDNFQQSFLRNPLYETPIEWYKDIKQELPKAILINPVTQMSKEGTDGVSSPLYQYYAYESMEQIGDDGIVFPASGSNPDTSVLIPLNKTDLALVVLSPRELYKNPIIREVVNTIKSDK